MMTQVSAQGNGNHLLAALPTESYERLKPAFEPMTFSLGEVVYESAGQ